MTVFSHDSLEQLWIVTLLLSKHILNKLLVQTIKDCQFLQLFHFLIVNFSVLSALEFLQSVNRTFLFLLDALVQLLTDDDFVLECDINLLKCIFFFSSQPFPFLFFFPQPLLFFLEASLHLLLHFP